MAKNLRKSDKEKLFFELFACFHVAILNLPMIIIFNKTESPDFISIHRKVGLEVVRSKIEKWKQLDSIVLKHYNKGLSAQEIRSRVQKECKHGFEGEITELGGKAVYSPVKGAFDTVILADRVIDVIKSKTALLRSYKYCKNYWLYIFTETSLIDEAEVNKINDVYQRLSDNNHYNRIYILAPPHTYVLFWGNDFQTKDFSNRMNHFLSCLAKKKSELD